MKHVLRLTVAIIVVAGAIAGAAFFLPSSGGGFEQLRAWTAVLDGDDRSLDHAFDFASPRVGFRVDGQAVEFVDVPSVVQSTLLDPRRDAAVSALTGLNLAGSATAVMVFDNAPRSLIMFATDPDPNASQAFTRAYDDRGFGSETIGGVAVRHIGEDGIFEPQRLVGQWDPFDKGIGQPQRVALVGDTLVGAANWDGIQQGVAGLAPDAACTACQPWRELVSALESEAGSGAHLTMASGWLATGFKADGQLSEAGLPLSLSPLPTFDYVLFATTERSGRHAAHLVVRFPDGADAEAGLTEITARMNAALTLQGRPEARLAVEKGTIRPIEGTGAAAAVLTIGANDGQPGTASTVYSTMGYLAVSRDFLGLAWN